MATHYSSFKLNKDFGETVTDICHKHYNSLSKKGKPQQSKEWTLLAAIVQSNASPKLDAMPEVKVVAMGTGSKCLGHSRIQSAKGLLIHDSHAEVIARRSFLRYLYQEIEDVYNSKSSKIFRKTENGLCELRDGVNFHLYTSHTPCGDASIFPKREDSFNNDEEELIVGNSNSAILQGINHSSTICKKKNLDTAKRKLNEYTCEDEPVEKYICVNSIQASPKEITVNKPVNITETPKTTINTNYKSGNENKALINNKSSIVIQYSAINCETENPGADDTLQRVPDIYRTGAKCVEGGIQDPQGVGREYHTLGALRTKPGRGERTLSMSCSDKMAKWNVVGIQGALLSQFLCRPIYLKSVTVGRCPFSKEAMERALIQRSSHITHLPTNYHLSNPVILQSDKNDFVHSKTCVQLKSGNSNIVPSSSAVIWWFSGKQEVSVDGHKQGVTSKHLLKPIARCDICKYNLFEKYHNLMKSTVAPTSIASKVSAVSTYKDCKSLAQDYQLACKQFYKVFQNWIHTPEDYCDFML